MLKTKGALPSEQATRKLLYLAIQEASKRWSHINGWKLAMGYFSIEYEQRIREAMQA